MVPLTGSIRVLYLVQCWVFLAFGVLGVRGLEISGFGF